MKGWEWIDVSLASMMGCSQQYVSKVLKGQENLSLETMSKIEDCLHISILQEELEDGIGDLLGDFFSCY